MSWCREGSGVSHTTESSSCIADEAKGERMKKNEEEQREFTAAGGWLSLFDVQAGEGARSTE